MIASTLRIALHDLRLVVTDRSAVIWMALMPVVFATFFGIVTGGGGPPDAKARLTVVDLDGGPLGRVLVEALRSERLEVVEMTPEEQAAAENPVRTLVIPAGFSTSVVAGQEVALRLEKESGSNEEASLVAGARVVGAIARVLGRVVEAAGGGVQPSPEQVAAVPAGVDLVVVESRWGGQARSRPDGFSQSIPGMAVMFVLLVALTYGSASLSAERAGGQLRRLVTAPVDRAAIVAGKIGGRVVVAWVQIAVLAAVGGVAHAAFGVPIGDHPLGVLLVLLAYAVAVAPLGVLFGALFTDPDQAAGVGVVATMVMAALGGCWWPLEIVSPALQKVALLFPSGWAMTALHRLISFGDPFLAVLGELAALGAFALLFGALAVRSLRLG